MTSFGLRGRPWDSGGLPLRLSRDGLEWRDRKVADLLAQRYAVGLQKQSRRVAETHAPG